MASYTSSAQVVVSVNGRQAQNMLKNLQQEAKKLEQAIEKAAAAGQKSKASQLQKQLNQTQSLMQRLTSSASSLDATLARLDKASPKELNKALSTLQKQLNTIERGSKAWDQQMAKIKRVKQEIQSVNAQMSTAAATQKSMFSGIANWFNQVQAAAMAAFAAVSGLVMAGRSAVKHYAEMEESMANTRKYTRMSAKEVEELNNIFGKMDTRLAREQLNLLAQEGGRLGYNTVQKVKEYTEAASVINVALVDLGEGATQTIAKISNIFGIEQMYGVRDAMLKVGSTVNHLSQNCTASKPFIVEFAKRLAGVGSTAKMAISDIMAFGATLDAHGQKVEMSATAIQRLIMELFKNPVEMARMVHLKGKKFAETLNRDVTEGLMTFLGALNRMGEKNALATLAPLFKDLGLDGVRVSSVLTNLSSHLDFLKWQLGEANKAFRDGSSASNEYAIFNNTVQASIDKAKNRVRELGIELGEKLYPVMKHIYTSSSLCLRLLKHIVEFFIAFKTPIVTVTGLLVVYHTALLLTTARTKAATAAHVLWNAAVKLSAGIIPGIRLLLAGLTNTVQYFTNGLQVNYYMQQRWAAAMGAMKFANWATLIAGVAASVYLLYNRTKSLSGQMREITQRAFDVEDATVREMRKLDELFGKLDAAVKGTEEYEKAKKAIIDQYGKYLQGLIDEKGEIMDLETAYDRLTEAIKRNTQERMINKVRQQLEDSFADTLSQKVNAMRRLLEEEVGMSVRDSVRIASEIMTSVVAGEGVSDSIQREIVSAYDESAAHNPLKWIWSYASSGAMFGKDNDAIKVLADILELADAFKSESQMLDDAAEIINPLRGFSTMELRTELELLTQALENVSITAQGLSEVSWSSVDGKQEVFIYDPSSQMKYAVQPVTMSAREAQERYDLITMELMHRGVDISKRLGEVDPVEEQEWSPYSSDKDGKGGKSDKFAKEKQWRQLQEAYALYDKARGYRIGKDGEKKSYSDYDYQLRLLDILVQYNEKIFENKKATYLEKNEAKAEGMEALRKKDELLIKHAIDKINKEFDEKEDKLLKDYMMAADYVPDKWTYDILLDDMKRQRLAKIHDFYDTKIKVRKKNASKSDSKGKKDSESVSVDLSNPADPALDLTLDVSATVNPPVHLNHRQIQSPPIHLENSAEEEKKKEKDSTKKNKSGGKESPFGSVDDYVYPELYDLRREALDKLNKFDNEKTMKDIDKREADRLAPAEAVESYLAPLRKLRREYDAEMLLLSRAYDAERTNVAKRNSDFSDYPGYEFLSEEEMLKQLEERFVKAQKKLREKYKELFEVASEPNQWESAVKKSLKWLESDPGKAIVKSYSTVVSSLADIFSQATSIIESELEAQTAAIEKRYDAELKRAEGNAYLIASIERRKEKDIAKAKAEANRKMFAMQVIQAVAQTATSALNAYSSAAAIPVVGYIMAPIAAAMATAAGLMQVAAIRKQQQASEAQGYAEGGFTRPGSKYEPAGVVHAGEWVASQALVNNPATRPILEALDYAQRTNTVGRLAAADVSRSLTAPMVIAHAAQAPAVSAASDQRLTAVVDRLARRLDEPFVTVNTVQGDAGIRKAQLRYQRLIANKSPKSR